MGLTKKSGSRGDRAGETRGGSRRWASWILALASLATSGALAELGLRAAGVSDPRVPSYYRIPHPVLGWALEPGAVYSNPLPEATVRVSYNSAGWRDVERDPVKPDGVFRVAVLGDSFMEAYSVEMGDAFHRRLGTEIAASGRRAETLNFGVAGYGTLQEYLAFQEAGRRYSPDLVLLGFCVSNDVRNNSRQLEQMLGGARVKVRSRPFLEDAADTWRVPPVDVAAARRRYDKARARRSGLLSAVYDRSALLQASRRTVSGLLADSAPSREDVEHALYGVHDCRATAEYRAAWSLTHRILQRLQDEARHAGARLAVFSVPMRREASRPHRRAVLRAVHDPGRLCLEEAAGYGRLAGVLEELGIQYIDLLPEFRRQSETTRLFRRSDRHWNERGHALAAAYVAAQLDRGGLLPKTTGRSEP